MKKLRFPCLAGLVLLLVGCTTVTIPPEQAAWAESVKQQIAQATDIYYVYIPVADKQQMKILEHLAFKQYKSTQRIKKDDKVTECIFVFRNY
jgi:hypothetical protein